jgi:hypothetical protein
LRLGNLRDGNFRTKSSRNFRTGNLEKSRSLRTRNLFSDGWKQICCLVEVRMTRWAVALANWAEIIPIVVKQTPIHLLVLWNFGV